MIRASIAATRLLFISLVCASLSIQPSRADVQPQTPHKDTAKEDLRVLVDGMAQDEMLHQYLLDKVHKALDANTEEYEKLKTPEQIAAYQKRMKRFFIEQLGGFPKRTPLRAKVTGTIQRDGYRVEKIIYQSQPKFYVTALLYLPDDNNFCTHHAPRDETNPPSRDETNPSSRDGKNLTTPATYPGVLVPCGHSNNGKASETYQQACILLAKNGFVVLCYDPIEQGERYQLLDKNGKPLIGNVKGHNALNVTSMLIGRNAATYRIWDGIRGIDYLVSRPEVDPERIGCTGNSGGGTLTSYIMALDERVDCAAPCCYLTSFERLLDTIGPQDAEQTIFGQIPFGMDHAEYVIMRAPRPTLMCTATHDFFDIAGSWDTFRRAKRIYARLGFPERVGLIETDAKHGFSKQLRVGAVRWMRRWLLGIDDAITEPESPILSDEEAQVTEKGQVVLVDGARTTYEIDADLEKQLAKNRQEIWQGDKSQALQAVRRVAGIRKLSELPRFECKKVGRVDRQGYHIEKLVLSNEPLLRLTALAFVPDNRSADADAYLFLNADGKAADAAVGGPIDELVKQGHLVLAFDPRAIGETEHKKHYYHDTMGPLWAECAVAYLMGTSMVAMQSEDIAVAAAFLRDYESPQKPRKVHLVSTGKIGVAALHTAALEPDLLESLTLNRCLDSWSDVFYTPMAKRLYSTLVFAALKTYDLPNLRSALPAEKLKVIEPLDAKGRAIKTP